MLGRVRKGLAVLRTPGIVRWLLIGLTLAAVIGIYAFIGSAGKAGPWPIYMNYYDLLAEGFRGGHLYVPVDPHPELLAKANPYDPQHVRLWFWDVSLYNGRYYMYWGPVPALFQAAAKELVGIPPKQIIGDQYLAFAMFSLAAIAGGLIIERLQRRLFPGMPLWLVLLSIFAFGLANPAPHLVASGGVYQSSIGAAQAFLLFGVVLAFDAVWRAQQGKPPGYRLVLAGVAWALAIGSRISVLPAAGVILLLTALGTAWPKRLWPLRELWPAARAVLAMGVPLGLGFALILLYNQLRFDDFLEFGTNLQLSMLKFRVSTDYWLANLYTYTLRPFKAACEFPYAMAPWHPPPAEAMAGWIGVPTGYLINEPVVGWLRVVLVTWWLPIAVVTGYRKCKGIVAAHKRGESVAALELTYAYLCCAFAVLATLTALVLLGMYMATMRYLSDVTNGLVLLGLLGAFTLVTSRTTRWGKWTALALVTVTLLGTVVYGLLLGYQGYTGHFKRFNPALDARLQQSLSTCDEAPPAPPRPHAQKRHKSAR